MNCTQTEPLLNALADHALPVWQAFRVRRHLAACPVCAAELVHIQRLDTAVRADNDVPLPSALGTQIAAALPPPAAFQNRRPFPIRPAAMGLAGIAAVLATVLWFLPGQPGQPTIAYADVMKAMASVKTANYTQELTIYDTLGKVRIHQVQQIWIRRHPAAIATITFPDALHPQKRQSLEDARGQLSLQPNGQWILRANTHIMSSDVEADLGVFGAVLSPTTKAGTGMDSATVKRTILNDQPTLKYTQIFHYKSFPKIPTEGHSTIWIDEKTKRCVRLETQTSHNGKPWMSDATSNVQYDMPPLAGLFDIVLPPVVPAADRHRTKTP